MLFFATFSSCLYRMVSAIVVLGSIIYLKNYLGEKNGGKFVNAVVIGL